jgi:protein tyrosine/serine phosphatase
MNPIAARRHVSAFLLVLSLVIPAARAAEAQTTSAAAASDVSKVRIDNFGQISPGYYRGGQPKGRDYTDLAALGVHTVINLTSDDARTDEKAMVEGAGMAYVQIPMTTHEPPTSLELARFLSIVNDPAQQPVFVHCVGGRHRTGIMTAVYRMTQDGWTSDQAFNEMKKFKFGASYLHPEFKAFVYDYPATLASAAPAPAAKAAVKSGGR